MAAMRVLQPGEIGQLVEGLPGDDGAVHVGDQQRLAAVGDGHSDGIDCRCAQRGTHRSHIGFGAQLDVGSLALRQDIRHTAAGSIAHPPDHGGGQGRGVALGDQGQDMAHRTRGPWQQRG